MKSIFKSKVFWTCVLAIVGSSAGYATGELDWKEAGAAILTALTGIFFRDAINSVGKAVVPLFLCALVLSGCGLLSSGTSGAAGEVGAATATNNLYLFVGFTKVAVDEDGNITAVSNKEGEAAGTPAGGIVVNLGREAVSAKTSSGGGSTGASQAGGSGDITPTIPIPTGLVPVD